MATIDSPAVDGDRFMQVVSRAVAEVGPRGRAVRLRRITETPFHLGFEARP